MRYILSIVAILFAIVFPSFCEFEILFDRYISVEVSPGEHADFEFYVWEPSRSIDTLYVELHKNVPDGWSVTACTPWECFFEHATYVLSGPDSAQFSAHFITADSVPGTGSMSMVFTNTHTGFVDSVVFEVSTSDRITNGIIPERTEFSAYPNPFNSTCRFEVPAGATLRIYDETGNIVFQDNSYSPQKRVVLWSPDDLFSSVYFAVVEGDGLKVVRKIIFTR